MSRTRLGIGRRPTAAAVLLAAALGAVVTPGMASAGHGDGGRQSRTSGVAVAGANIYVWSTHRSEDAGGGCTLSFVVRSRATGLLGALTAGHCVATLDGGPSYTIHQTRNVHRGTTDPGIELGTVAAGQFRFGGQGDSAFMQLSAGRAARAAVFVGGPHAHRSIGVAGTARLGRGVQVCYSGAVTGEHCGFRVMAHPRVVRFSHDGQTYRVGHEWRATGRTCTSRAGDSGSPVYVRRGGAAYAVGILSGAQQRAGRCPFFFTPVSLALRRLDLQLISGR